MKLQNGLAATGRTPRLGLVEWFRPGEHDRVEQALEKLHELQIGDLRTAVSWADWHTPHGAEWFHWLLPRLAREIELLPCFLYTPPSLGLAPRAAAPPREPKAYADFLDHVIDRFGHCFDTVELWNEPNNLSEYDWTLDPQWGIFCEMVGGAAHWAKQRGMRTVLGGMAPADPNWLHTIGCGGVLQYIDVVSIHGFPGTWEFSWQGWEHYLDETREVMEQHGCGADIWITETGFSTWRHDYHGQLRAFLQAVEAPVDRVYWYGLQDLNPEYATVDGFHSDERDYHFGLMHCDGSEKLLCRVWREEGLGGLHQLQELTAHMPGTPKLARPAPASAKAREGGQSGPGRRLRGRVLITGGAGFVGTNLADRLLCEGRPVTLYDSLVRPGTEGNLHWLHGKHGDKLQLCLADVRDPINLREALADVEQVYHFAAQVAVTTSVTAPAVDFEVNALGTIRLLEELRRLPEPPPLIMTSTNKVYGSLEDIRLRRSGQRYEPVDPALRRSGIGEGRDLDFHSPYGCSKGAADQYVQDYARTYGLQTIVFRMSCIYGPHQMGNEDQGWVAHFLRRAHERQPITIYGDGCQVRDVLYVADLVEAFMAAERNLPRLAGEVFNIGGGPQNTVSLLDLLDEIANLLGERPRLLQGGWRVGDQRYYVSDTAKFRQATGWRPTVAVSKGLRSLHDWLVESEALPPAPVVRHSRGGFSPAAAAVLS